jgi:hypothetical protein
MAVSPVKQARAWLLLGALALNFACSAATAPKNQPTALTPAAREEQDPEFWRLWQERRGLGE